jgi:hypothetical protein
LEITANEKIKRKPSFVDGFRLLHMALLLKL